jgi:iron(III) transport system ATP-binding protein
VLDLDLDLDLERDAADGPARVLLRPEQLRLGAPGPGLPGGRVRTVDFYGHDARVWLELPGRLTVSARLEGTELPVEGQDVSVSVLGPALHFPALPIPVEPFPAGADGPDVAA